MRCTSTIWWNVLFLHVFLQQLLQTKVVVVPTTTCIPQILSLSLRYCRGFYPHFRRNTAGIVTITAITEVAVWPPSSSPCHSLPVIMQNSQFRVGGRAESQLCMCVCGGCFFRVEFESRETCWCQPGHLYSVLVFLVSRSLIGCVIGLLCLFVCLSVRPVWASYLRMKKMNENGW